MLATTLRTGYEQVLLGRRVASLLLCTVLAACQPAAPTASAAASAPPAAQAPAAARYPDASYSAGRLRPAYFRCVEGVQHAGTLQACGREELAYHQKHLQATTGTLVAGLDGEASAAFAATEAAWRRDTDHYCTAAANAAVPALQAAQECRLSRVAYRADALLAHIRPRDTSFTQASLRPQYTRCVQDARGMDDTLEACDAAEFSYQQKQLDVQVARLMASPDSPAKDRWMNEQAFWAIDTGKRCAPISDHVGALLDAQSCRINRYANRAVELQAHTLAPGLQ